VNIVSIYREFPTEKSCIDRLETVKWKGTPTCPYCKSTKQTPMPKEARYHCNTCNTTYSVTVGTIFHNTKLDLQKWFLGVALMLNAKKGLSARQLARDLEVNKNTAWFMAMRIRQAMLDDGALLKGIVEMDETYIGGKPRKGGRPGKRGRGTKKTPVVGMVELDGKIRAKVAPKLNSKRLMQLVRRNVNKGESILITDEFKGYSKANSLVLRHLTINHSVSYAQGAIHTNTIEGFWALLKRGIVGQYHKVSLSHLQKYVNEFAFRYNIRKNDDVFNLTLTNALGV
jgi:transposase-like protein